MDEYLRPWGVSFASLQRATDDVVRVAPRYVGPALPPNTSPWGWTTRPVSYSDGAYDEFDFQPLAGEPTLASLERHPWPRVDDFEPAQVPADLANRALMLIGGNPFETLTWLAGLETVLILLVEDPAFIDAAMARITSIFAELTESSLASLAGRADAVFFADDLGGQTGPMMSREVYRRLLMPHHRRLFDIAHRHHAAVVYHTDGSVFDLLGDLVEAGVDCLEAVQVECAGMDPQRLKAAYGSSLAFHGAVSVQQLLPHGTSQQVRAGVRELIDVLGAGGGYICAPSHAIQARTPPENVVAMLEEAKGMSLDAILAES